MKKISLFCATTALVMPAMLSAQSTGSVEVEETIVVTARSASGVDGIVVPDSTKARGVLTSEIIQRQQPGQSILDTINLIPGVNFTNSDAYGSSGGNIRIRGFDGNRISLTWDGMPLNDTGNYAIFSNQQFDPELIQEVNVNLGTTEVDSPTASAAGGTVNYRTRLPGDDVGGLVSASYGEDDYHRLFGVIDTGVLTSFGTKAFLSASFARNDKFKGPGEIYKQQYNGRLYQPLGSNGDFISVAGHFNRNRNNFYRNPSVSDLRGLLVGEIPAAGAFSPSNPVTIGGYSEAQEDLILGFENEARCFRPTPGPGAQNDGTGAGTACTNFFELRINPSDTGNIRGSSRFTLTDTIILTIDPSYQYVLANGGGTTLLAENSALARGSLGTASPGVDYNGDGDFADTVRFYTPNNTNTNRYGLTASLIWDITPEHRFRVAYTYDRGRHRQTGEWGFLDRFGRPENPFGGRNGRDVLAADGFQLQQRDRFSIALLNQIAGQYIGRFMDNRLRVEIGLRAPFFKRELNQFGFTQTGGAGFATCTSQPATTVTIVPPTQQAPFPSNSFFAPFETDYKFDELLPNVGFTYKFDNGLSMFGSYAKGFSAPRTDNLYRAPVVEVDPETTDAFDLGARFTTSRVQAQATAWYIGFKNRIVTSFDPELGLSIDRNIGKVDSHGVDASIAFKPIPQVSLLVFGSYIDTEIKDDIQIGTVPAGRPGAGNPLFAPTSGKFVPETPEWQFGGRAQVEVGPVEIGIQGKWVDDRFATDVNDVKVEGYTTVNLDARYSFADLGLPETYLQLNVQNLFNEFYFGNISTQINASNICPPGDPTPCTINNSANPNFSVGAPRTISATLRVGF